MGATDFAPEDEALLALLRRLERDGYRFVTPTPATHGRVVARMDRRIGRSIRDVLGWSLPFLPGTIGDVEADLEAAGMLDDRDGLRMPIVRVSSLDNRLFLHSAYPTEAEDSVFFGPDSYRFAALLQAVLPERSWRGARIVDIGGGAGVGAVVLAALAPDARIAMTDINPRAIRLARINAAAAGARIEMIEGRDLSAFDAPLDLVTANPPYIADEAGRSYRDGGDMRGARVSLDMARMAVERLAPGGRFILYTGSAIVEGRDGLRDALAELCGNDRLALDYREIDPDVFGEELDTPPYRDVERIALVAATIDRIPGKEG